MPTIATKETFWLQLSPSLWIGFNNKSMMSLLFPSLPMISYWTTKEQVSIQFLLFSCFTSTTILGSKFNLDIHSATSLNIMFLILRAILRRKASGLEDEKNSRTLPFESLWWSKCLACTSSSKSSAFNSLFTWEILTSHLLSSSSLFLAEAPHPGDLHLIHYQ